MLAGSSIPLCLDTGHLLIGGTDPLELAKAVPNRIAHTHLKDVDAALAAKVQSGELTYTEAVKAGMYTPLGTGDVDIAGIVSVLRDNGFDGWFVLEQDTILDGEPTDEGPVRDVLASVGATSRGESHGDDPAHRRSRRVADRRGRRSSVPPPNSATGWWRWRRGTGRGPSRSPRSTAWSGFSTTTRR